MKLADFSSTLAFYELEKRVDQVTHKNEKHPSFDKYMRLREAQLLLKNIDLVNEKEAKSKSNMH